GTAEQIFNDPQHPYLKALLHAVPRFNMEPGERLVPLREIRHETGELLVKREPWPPEADKAGPLLRVENVTKRYSIRKSGWFANSGDGEVEAVAGVGFDIRRGECLGLVGESGCGK